MYRFWDYWRKATIHSVIQRIFKFQKFFWPYRLSDLGGQLLELVQVARPFYGQIEPKPTQTQSSRQTYGDGVRF